MQKAQRKPRPRKPAKPKNGKAIPKAKKPNKVPAEGALSPKGYLSVQAFADHFDVSEMSVYRLIKRGKVPHLKFGRLVKLPKNAIELYERQNIQGEPALVERIWGK